MIKTYLTDADKATGKEDYFQKVGDTFYKAQESVFGKVSNYYAVDPFHEAAWFQTASTSSTSTAPCSARCSTMTRRPCG